MATAEKEVRRHLASAYEVLMGMGLLDFAGDVSVRVPAEDAFLIRHTRADLYEMPERMPTMTRTSWRNIIKVDLDGNQLDGRVPPPLEVHTHVAIYRARPDAAAVAHAHARMATAFSMVSKLVEPVYARGVESTREELTFFDRSDPIGTPELGAELATALGTGRACMMKSHGLVTVGSTIEGACLALINLEDAAFMQWLASAIGEPEPLPDATIERRRKVWENPVLTTLVWRYYEEITGVHPRRRLRRHGVQSRHKPF